MNDASIDAPAPAPAVRPVDRWCFALAALFALLAKAGWLALPW